MENAGGLVSKYTPYRDKVGLNKCTSPARALDWFVQDVLLTLYKRTLCTFRWLV